MDLEVNLGGLKMRTPVTTASGTFGYGTEYVGALDYSKLGAVTAKGVRLDAWPGNPMPRHVEVFGGMATALSCRDTNICHRSPSYGTPAAMIFTESMTLPPPSAITTSTFSRRQMSTASRMWQSRGLA